MTSIINILSKNPELADCKSRLKKYLSRDERIFLTKKMLEMICSEIIRVDAEACLHFFPNDNGKYIEWLSKKFKIKTQNQKQGYLSDKIYSALDEQKEIYKKRIVIGSDIPTLSVDELTDCIVNLDKYDLIIGPSVDGGFYLVGVTDNVHKIFKDMELDKISFKDILKKCISSDISYKVIRTLKDIDTFDDLTSI